MSAKNTYRIVCALTAVGLGMLMTGCGGGGGDSKSDSAGGRVALRINWPAASQAGDSRYLPPYARSLVFEMHKTEHDHSQGGDHDDGIAPTYRLVVTRPNDKPSTQVAEFNMLIPAGEYALAGVARTEADGSGSTVASAATQVDVKPNVVTDVALSLNSTIQSLTVLGQPVTLEKGTSLALAGEAKDPEGNVLFIQAAALQWSLVSGQAYASLTPQGVAAGIAPGTARVRVTEPGAGISGEADLVIVGQGGIPSGLADSGWPKFLGDAANTGRGAGSGAVGQFKWTHTGPTYYYKTPILGKDGSVIAGDYHGNLRALDPSSGSVRWTAVLNSVESAPAVASDGTIYVAALSSLVALNGTSGAQLWKFDVPGYAYVRSSPNVGSDGTVYVGSENGKLYALNGSTGQKVWEFTTGGAIWSSPAIAKDGTIYFGSDDRRLYALDSKSGAKRWDRHLGINLQSTPSIGDDGTIYLKGIDDGTVIAIDAATSATKWQADINGSIGETLAIGLDGTVYATTHGNGGYSHRMVAINGGSGTTKWEYPLVEEASAGPALGVDGTVYVPTYDGKVLALNGGTGAKKWELPNTGVIPNPVSVGPDGTLYAATQSKTVIAIR